MAGLGFLRDLLTNDKAPYMVTLFVAAFTWVAHRTTERLSGTPFVEYRISPSQNERGALGVTLRIRNITEASRFDCILITLKPRASESLKFDDSAGQRHGIQGTALTLLTAEITKPTEWAIRATNVAPGTDNWIFIPAKGAGEPAAMVQSCTEVSEASADDASSGGAKGDGGKAVPASNPILVRWGVRPFFVENELLILWTSLVMWLLLLYPSAQASRHTASNSPPSSSPP
jgi:hypothetical protein